MTPDAPPEPVAATDLRPATPVQDEAAAPSPPAIDGVAKEPELRVQLSGRLGANPTFRKTPKGRLIGKFPLGVRDEADETKVQWHTVLAFDARAEQVRETLRKGDAVQVIGYRHERQVPGRNGPRTIAEIYATVLRPR